MTDILQAARSYYGLADTDVRKTDIYTNEAGQPMLVFEIAFTNDEFFGIADRMKAMNQAEGQQQPDTAIIEGPTVQAMREAYNALSKAEKGRYGSFARYMTECSTGIIDVYTGEPYNVPAPPAPPPTRSVVNGRETKESIEATRAWTENNKAATERKVIHVDAPEEPDPVSMDAVWVPGIEITHEQSLAPVEYNGMTNDYLIPWAMLTDEQKQKQKAKEANP